MKLDLQALRINLLAVILAFFLSKHDKILFFCEIYLTNFYKGWVWPILANQLGVSSTATSRPVQKILDKRSHARRLLPLAEDKKAPLVEMSPWAPEPKGAALKGGG